jgi:hypothetical protein
MDYSTEDLPISCLMHFEDKGNFQTRNARFRTAVCQHLRRQVVIVNGSGNCFFESVTMLLREAGLCPDTLTALQLRRDVVNFFRACIDSQEDFCERVLIEIESELQEELVCSSRVKVNGVRVHGLVPATIEIYLDAVEQEGVWVQGSHWLRAISLLYNVRVAVVIYGHPIVRFFGQGHVTIYLYKIDADTHFDPMLPLAPDQALVAVEPQLSAATSATQQCLLPHSNTCVVISDDDGLSLPTTAATAAPGECAPFTTLKCTLPQSIAVRRTIRMQCGIIYGKHLSSSNDDDNSETERKRTTAAAAAPGECAPCTTLKCTLPHTLIQ